MRRIHWIVLIALLLSGLVTATVFAQEPTPTDDEVNRIAKQLYCPVCENTPLDVCPTEACRQWRDLIRQMLSEGKSEQEIKDYFVLNYGVRVLSEPPRSGFFWLIYVVPPIAIVAGAFMLFRALRSWSRPSASEADEVDPGLESPADDEYIARLEAELKKRK